MHPIKMYWVGSYRDLDDLPFIVEDEITVFIKIKLYPLYTYDELINLDIANEDNMVGIDDIVTDTEPSMMDNYDRLISGVINRYNDKKINFIIFDPYSIYNYAVIVIEPHRYIWISSNLNIPKSYKLMIERYKPPIIYIPIYNEYNLIKINDYIIKEVDNDSVIYVPYINDQYPIMLDGSYSNDIAVEGYITSKQIISIYKLHNISFKLRTSIKLTDIIKLKHPYTMIKLNKLYRNLMKWTSPMKR